MNLETNNKKVAELVHGARGEIIRYRQTKNHDLLASAATKLGEAVEEDPGYLDSLYFSAQLDDLTGRAKEAIEKFEHVLTENPPFRDEVEYYLGVAHYHRYNRRNLEKAIERFSSVAARAGDSVLKCRARLGIVQALAMRLIPSDPRHPDSEKLEADSLLLEHELRSVQTALTDLRGVDATVMRELMSVFQNTKALNWMYATDFLWSREEKVRLLQRALDELQQADQCDPDNWAIQCDLGSTWMRLAHWGHSDVGFANARHHLNSVLQSLRPGYGFAVYELGRTCRLQGEFAEAIECFDQALTITYDHRDVSDRRVHLEKDRAVAKSRDYP